MNTRGLYVLVGTVAAVAVLVTLLPFAVALRELPMARNSSTPWSEFGSYVGGVLGSVAALLNLVVVLFIATRLTELQQNQLATKRLTIDLYTEWHAEAMHQSRIVLSDHIEQMQQHSSQIPTLSAFERYDPARSVHAFRIYHFFEKWAVLNQEAQIDPRLMNAALGKRAMWWNERFFAPIHTREHDPYILEALELIQKQVFARVPT